MISILQIRAYGDFNEPYEINIAAGDSEKIYSVCRVLNTFCRNLPGCDQDVKLSTYLEDHEYIDQLTDRLVERNLFSKQQAVLFVEKLNGLCKGNSVYVYENAFRVDDVVQI